MKVKKQQLCSKSPGPGVLHSKRAVRGSGGQGDNGSAKEGDIYRVYCIPGDTEKVWE